MRDRPFIHAGVQMTTKCFLVTATNRWKLNLRRYSRDDENCPGPYKYHNAHSPIIDVVTCEPNASGDYVGLPQEWDHADHRWPTKCEYCDHVFSESAERQVFHDHIYVDEHGVEHSIRDAKPGQMWFVPWYFDPARDTAPDDLSKQYMLSPYYYQDWSKKRPPIVVVCPNGRHWIPDQRASNGEGWKVTGDVPLITCSPSIAVPGYHGWLRDGVFTDDCEGRGPNGVPA